jgi:hypothetical protein
MGEQMFTMKNEVVVGRLQYAMILPQRVDQKFCVREGFTISEFSCKFPQISRTVLYEIITVRLGYHKFCARWIRKMLKGAHKMQRMTWALTFSQRYHKDSDEFLNHIV